MKYRQTVFENGKFKEFHYWGIIDLIGNGKTEWVGPLTNKLGVTDVADSQQFSGEVDRNGIEIYEGSFIRFDHRDTQSGEPFDYEVKFVDSAFRMHHRGRLEFAGFWGILSRVKEIGMGFTVIGNNYKQ